MKNTSYSLFKIAAIFIIALVMFSNSVYADINDDKYMKVHIRNVTDTLIAEVRDSIPEFYNDSAIQYQEDDQIISENLTDIDVTVCFRITGGDSLCFDLNPNEVMLQKIPIGSYSLTVKPVDSLIITDAVTLVAHKPVPSLSTYGLILLLFLLMISTVVVMRRRASRAVSL